MGLKDLGDYRPAPADLIELASDLKGIADELKRLAKTKTKLANASISGKVEAPTNRMILVAAHESAGGTSRHFAATQ